MAGGVGAALDPLWRRLAAGIPRHRWLAAPVDPPAVLGLAVGLLAAALAATAGAAVIPLAPIAVVASAIDVRWHRLPDRLTGAAAAVLALSVLAVAVVTGDPALIGRAAAGAFVLAGLLLLVHFISPRGMGFGDVKFGVPLGLALGAASLADVVLALVAASILGALAGVVVLVRHRDRARAFAFGPCLCAGALLVLLAA